MTYNTIIIQNNFRFISINSKLFLGNTSPWIYTAPVANINARGIEM